jgi:hypothetical protein
MILSYVLIPVAGYIDANRTKMMTDLQGMTLTVGAICRISFVTSFYALFLPGYLAGGVIRWHRLSRHDRKPAQALAIVVFGRLFSTIITVGLGLACWCLDERARTHLAFGVVLLALLAGLLFAYWLMFSGNRARSLAAWIARQRWVPAALGTRFCKVLNSAGRFEQLSASRLLSTAALLLLNEVIGVMSFYLLAVSVGLGLSVLSIGWIRTCVMLVTLLPLSIMGLGVRETSLIAILGIYGLSPALAVAYSLLLLSRTVLIGLFGGALELWNVFRYRTAAITGSVRP